MKLSHLILTASLLALPAACATNVANDAALQETASLMATLTQHPEGASITDASTELDTIVNAAPDDPYVLKLAAITRTQLANASQDRAERVKLRHDALAQFDHAISLSKPDAPARTVKLNGQDMDVHFHDLADLRASLFHTVQTDR
jgi:anaerobic glycerol-3-phosphate dehydrogenase